MPGDATRVLAVTPPERTASVREAARVGRRRGAAASSRCIELTTALGSNAVAGPLARETFARTTALDLRPQQLPRARVRAGLGGAHARDGPAPADADLFLHLFGAGYADYIWTVFVGCRRSSLGGRAIGFEALRGSPTGGVGDA